MMDRQKASAPEGQIPGAWVGREVMLETTEALSSQFSRYFYPWSVVGWIHLVEEDERDR